MRLSRRAAAHNSQFYRFLKKTKHSVLENLLVRVNRILIDEKVLGLDVTAADSKPVKASTKENNPKNPRRNLRNKAKKPKRNPKATLGYYSYISRAARMSSATPPASKNSTASASSSNKPSAACRNWRSKRPAITG